MAEAETDGGGLGSGMEAETDEYEGKGCGQRGRETYPRREEELG